MRRVRSTDSAIKAVLVHADRSWRGMRLPVHTKTYAQLTRTIPPRARHQRQASALEQRCRSSARSAGRQKGGKRASKGRGRAAYQRPSTMRSKPSERQTVEAIAEKRIRPRYSFSGLPSWSTTSRLTWKGRAVLMFCGSGPQTNLGASKVSMPQTLHAGPRTIPLSTHAAHKQLRGSRPETTRFPVTGKGGSKRRAHTII